LVSTFRNRIDHKALLFAFAFSVFLFLFERAVFKVDYANYIRTFQAISTSVELFYLTVVLLSLLVTFIFFYVSFGSSRTYQLIYFVVFTVTILFEYSYQKAFGRFSYFTDLQIASFTTAEQKQNAVTTYFNFFALIRCLLYGLL